MSSCGYSENDFLKALDNLDEDAIMYYANKENVDFNTEISGFLPIHIIVSSSKCEKSILKVLVANGADINKVSSRGDLTIQLALFSGSDSCINFLLDRGINLDVTDSNGLNPLHYAIARQNISYLDVIATRIPDRIYETTKNGRTIFDMAHDTKNSELIKFTEQIKINGTGE